MKYEMRGSSNTTILVINLPEVYYYDCPKCDFEVVSIKPRRVRCNCGRQARSYTKFNQLYRIDWGVYSSILHSRDSQRCQIS